MDKSHGSEMMMMIIIITVTALSYCSNYLLIRRTRDY